MKHGTRSWLFLFACAVIFYVITVPESDPYDMPLPFERKDSLAMGFGHLHSIRTENDSTVSERMYDAAQHALVRYVFTNGRLAFIQMIGFEKGMLVKYRAHIDLEKSLLWTRKRIIFPPHERKEQHPGSVIPIHDKQAR